MAAAIGCGDPSPVGGSLGEANRPSDRAVDVARRPIDGVTVVSDRASQSVDGTAACDSGTHADFSCANTTQSCSIDSDYCNGGYTIQCSFA